MQQWILRIRPWELLTSGGKEVVGSGESACVLRQSVFSTNNNAGRDVAAGIAILQEAGGLITTANPPEDPLTAKIEDIKLGSRLYLAIR